MSHGPQERETEGQNLRLQYVYCVLHKHRHARRTVRILSWENILLVKIKLYPSKQRHKFPVTFRLGVTTFFFFLAHQSPKLHFVPKQNDKILQPHNIRKLPNNNCDAWYVVVKWTFILAINKYCTKQTLEDLLESWKYGMRTNFCEAKWETEQESGVSISMMVVMIFDMLRNSLATNYSI